MQVQIEVATDTDAYEGLTAHVRGVVERALGRYADRVTRVDVYLSEDRRHEGGADDKRCLMEARLEGRAPTVVAHRAASLNEVVHNLELLATDNAGDTLRRAGKLCAELRFGQLDEILATGLHAFLTQFLDRVNDLGSQISRDFLVPLPQ